LPVLLMTVVSCSDDTEEEPKLNIYVYAPDRAGVTRSEVLPTKDEAKIYNLQIWVFRSSNPSKMVASLTLTTEAQLQELNENKSAAYSIALKDRSFAGNPEPVDIYVLANVNYPEEINNGAKIDEAVFNGGHFFSFTNGPSYQAATTVPEGKGIPLSGVARGKSVVERNNVLHVNDANLKLTRTISKIRFVFSSLDGLAQEGRPLNVFIGDIKLNRNMLYEKERFFLDGDHPSYWVEGSSFDEPVLLSLGDRVNPVVKNDDPVAYAYSSAMSDGDYEDLVNEGIRKGELTEFGPVYLPESDKRLAGTIQFWLGKEGPLEADFSMTTGNFHRNQTWIVYAYYIGSSKLVVNTVSVVDWEEIDDLPEHDIPNW
jgi:hypothetical protein